MSEAGVSFVEINPFETGTVPPSQGEDGKEGLVLSHFGFLPCSEEIAKGLNALGF